jgi:hypothetical protein
VNEPTIIAVDWSGAQRRSDQLNGIVLAVADGTDVTYSGGRTRDETVDAVIERPGPLVVGFDFSFGFPAWFAHERGCATADQQWELAAGEGDAMLAPTLPFWRDAGTQPPVDRRFRRCEERLRSEGFSAKSVFQCVGNGQVGPGSVRGMPLLRRLRDHGFSIWPFDPSGDRTAVEIYPTALRPLAPARYAEREYPTKDIRDAVLSAAVMWEHRDEFAMLPVAADGVTQLEGDVWLPSAWP